MQLAALEAAGRAADMATMKTDGAALALEVALKVLTQEVSLVAEVAAESAAHGNAALDTDGPHTSHSHVQNRIRLDGSG